MVKLICVDPYCPCFGDNPPSHNGVRCFICNKPLRGYAPVGAIVFNAYWRFVYRVVSHNDNGSVTIEQIEHPLDERPATDYRAHKPGDVWSHRTPLDVRDQILALPIRAA